MKRKLVFSLFGLLVSLAAPAQPADTWVNWGVITAPPDIPPQIDAINVVNSNTISIFFTNFTVNPELFDTSDTLNFTNTGSMFCTAGWRFDTAPAIAGLRHPALSLYNSGSIFASSGLPFVFGTQAGGGIGTVLFGFNFGFGGAKIIGSADYIYNSGVMQAGFNGLLRLTGGDLSLSRGEVSLEDSGAGGSGVFDNYWGARTNIIFPAFQFDTPFPFTPTHQVTQLLDHVYFTTFAQLALNNPQTWVNETIIGTNRTVQIVLLSEPNPAISNNVYFLAPGSFVDIGVEWMMTTTNPVTGDVITNYLSAGDGYFDPPTTNNAVMTNNIMPGGAVTFIPTNFFVQPGQFFSLFGFPPDPRTPIAGIFSADVSQQVTNQYGAYSALLQPFSAATNDVAGRYVTNLAGRVELSASRVMDLNRTRMPNLNVVSLKSTNHFAGNTNAQISSAFWDIDLATTNSWLSVSNLLMPLSRMNGLVSFYRARWTNQTPAGAVTNTSVYHVLFVDSHLNSLAAPQVNDFYLRKNSNTDVSISDEVDIMRNFQINARNLTITSNNVTDPVTYPTPFSPFGEINLQSGATLWASALPNLVNLTNHGLITIQNAAFFGGQRVSPFISSGPGDWYDSFINDGIGVFSQGLTIYSRYVNSSTVLDSGLGPLTIYAGNASITNGILFATNGAVGLFSGSLLTSNSFIVAGGPLTLSITNFLDDGSLTNCAQFVTNKPLWLSQGFNLLNLPPFSSLLATTVTNSSLAYHQVFNKWAGADKGTDPAGYVNNAAVGQLILDGGHPDSLFTFQPANGNNAIYVDHLELKGYATNNANDVYYGVDIQPGMVIYFARATANGVDISEKLDGDNGGRFRWVNNYNCGSFSSVMLTNPVNGVVYTMNQALREACDIDSDLDGVQNCLDFTPLGDTPPACNCPAFAVPSFVTGDNTGFDPGSSTNVFIGAPTLHFPGPIAHSDDPITQTFADVQGTYHGLFAETNSVTAATAGYFTATTTKKGTVSAKFMMGGRTYSFSGAFDANGVATGRISRGPLHALNVALRLSLSGGNQISGSVSDSRWTSQIVANRLTFDKVRNPATSLAGAYTLDIPGDPPGTGRPAGDGFGTVKIDTGGNVQFAGALADGTKISQKSAESATGVWPFYASLYQGTGVSLGWVELINHRLAGQVVWIRPAGTMTAVKNYATGFTNRVDAAGISYTIPARGANALPWNYGQAIFNGGGLSGFWTNSFYLDLPSHQFITDNASLKFSVTPSSGLFQGTVLNPNNNQTIKFQGVLFQNIDVGLGYFLNSDQSGQIYLGPAP